VAAGIARVAHEKDYIASDYVVDFSGEQQTQSTGYAPASLMFGGNVRVNTIRAGKLLGCSPSRVSTFDVVPHGVKSEAGKLKLTTEVV
jgi:hypothetical protein